jgi:XTP/dITP diphosphohydrolase
MIAIRHLRLATTNRHKAVEIERIVAGFGVGIAVQDPADAAMEVDEWGATFSSNATLKACACLARTGTASLADDSGIEVDALDRAPGVHSARWSGAGASDASNNRRLVEELRARGLTSSSARYQCAIALALPGSSHALDPGSWRQRVGALRDERSVQDVDLGDVRVVLFTGTMEGRVVVEPRGAGGFGYDPYFRLPDGTPLAELDPDRKNSISHRGQALRMLSTWLTDHADLIG